MYDSLNRIQQAYSSDSTWGETFSPTATAPGVAPSTPGIDAWGNLTNRSGVTGKTHGETLSVTAGTNNQLGGFTYDAAGNLYYDGVSTYYHHDAENRLVTPGGYTYYYDGDGNRVAKSNGSTGTLYWRGPTGDPISESGLTGTSQEEYIFFNGSRIARRDVSGGAVHYYFSDHLGSHGVVENATGSSCEQDIDYYPYGGVVNDYCATVTQHYRFTGKERDAESGLDNFGFRYFGSSLGRFMSPDEPLYDGDYDDPQKLNLYAYARNNPLNSIDPDGHRVEICDPNGGNCQTISDQDFALAQQQDKYNHAPSLSQLQSPWNNGALSNITDSNGNTVGTVMWVRDDPAGTPVEGITPLGERYLGAYAMSAGVGRALGAAWGAAAGWFGRGAEAAGATAGKATFQEILQGAVEDASGQSTKSGGIAQATKDFEALEGQSQNLGRVQMKELPDGGKAVLRNFSKDGRPTLEYQPASGGSKTQWIRYNP